MGEFNFMNLMPSEPNYIVNFNMKNAQKHVREFRT